MSAAMCLSRSLRLAVQHKPMWVSERVQLIVSMWRRHTQFIKAEKLGKALPTFEQRIPEWDAWVTEHHQQQLKILTAEAVPQAQGEARFINWVKFRQEAVEQRAKLEISDAHFNTTLLWLVLHRWNGIVRTRGKEMRGMRAILHGWKNTCAERSRHARSRISCAIDTW